MFWTNMAPKPTIMISSLDGTQTFSLVTFDSGMPGDLAIDHEKKRIYWIDTRNRKIESVDFQGEICFDINRQ